MASGKQKLSTQEKLFSVPTFNQAKIQIETIF